MTYVRKIYLAAAFGTAMMASLPSYAGEQTTMIYGSGTLQCKKAVKVDWMVNGIYSWVQGYMTAMSEAAPEFKGRHSIILNGEPDDLAKMVFKQCQHDPDSTVAEASDKIATRLLKIQGVGSGNEDGQQF